MDLTEDSLYYLNLISNVGGKPDAKTVNTVSQTDCKIEMFYVHSFYELYNFFLFFRIIMENFSVINLPFDERINFPNVY